MAKLIVPFVPLNPRIHTAQTKFVQTSEPRYQEYRTLEGHLINSENDVVAGQKFIDYWHTEKEGIFRSMNEVFEAELTVVMHGAGGWVFLEDSKKLYTYIMAISELTHMIRTKNLVNGTVEGVFGFVSKGRSISLKSVR